jgi:hypothetical protein
MQSVELLEVRQYFSQHRIRQSRCLRRRRRNAAEFEDGEPLSFLLRPFRERLKEPLEGIRREWQTGSDQFLKFPLGEGMESGGDEVEGFESGEGDVEVLKGETAEGEEAADGGVVDIG